MVKGKYGIRRTFEPLPFAGKRHSLRLMRERQRDHGDGQCACSTSAVGNRLSETGSEPPAEASYYYDHSGRWQT
jgi:hypothetical protein